MHLLKYNEHKPYGIFGLFQFAGDSVPFMTTLSHAYEQPDGGFQPIVLPGSYECKRGVHALADGIEFETFEIIGVDGHSGLLFHAGNFQSDSHGCTLCGAGIVEYHNQTTGMDEEMITRSRTTFFAWMNRFAGVDSFMLQVLDDA